MAPEGVLDRWLAGLAARRVPAFLGDAAPTSGQELLAAVDAAGSWVAAQSGGGVALYDPDAAGFAARLLAAWRAGRCVHVLPEQRAIDAIDVAAGASDAAVCLLTSGSTGAPGTVTKSLVQLEHELGAIEALLGPRVAPDALVVATVPHQHYYGFVFRLLWPLFSGRTAFEPTLRFPEAIAGVPAGGDAMLVSSPAFLRAVCGLGNAASLRERCALVLSAGSRLDAEVAAVLLAAGLDVVDLYGSTETGAVAARRPPASAFRPLPGVAARIDADQGLAIRAPHAGDGEWLRTGDRARAAEDGRAADAGFELLGRADRLAKVADQRVSLDAVEAALRATGLVAAARVVLLGDAEPVLAAVIVANAAGAAELARLGAFAFGRLLRSRLAVEHAAALQPKRWRFLAALPENPLGKSSVAELQALFGAPVEWPTVLESAVDGNAVTLTLYADPALECFVGHFPGMPIVPGVAQVEWALHFGRRHFALPECFHGMDALKFHRVILPGARLQLRLAWQATAGVLEFALSGGAQPHASGRLRFAP